MQQRRPALRASHLSDQQWRVLRVLRSCENGLETGRLAEQAFILGPSLTGILVRMEKNGLVVRSRRHEDARCSLVHATAQGLELAATLSDTIEAQYQDLAERLGNKRLAQLYALLDELIALPRANAVELAPGPTEEEEGS